MNNKVTELEGCVLGLIWEMDSCTTYAIRKVFLKSPNPYWSGSSGAIYPLIRRLDERGLIESEEVLRGKQRSDVYRLTTNGHQALLKWLGPTVHDRDLTIPVDPLRTRARFLGVLSDDDRTVFLVSAREQLLEQIADAENESKRFDLATSPYPYLVARGVKKVAEARLKWIEEVRRAMG